MPDGAVLLPATVRLQRAFLRWLSHSRFVSVFSQLQVLMLKGVPLLSLLLVSRRAWRLSRLLQRLQKRPLVVLGKSFVELWAFMELSFWLYFCWKKQRLEARRAYQPSVLWKKPGERRKLLGNFLTNINRIYANNRDDSMWSPGGPETSRSLRRRPSTGSQVRSRASRADLPCRDSSVHEAKARLISAPSVENFLRYYKEEEEEEEVGVSATHHRRKVETVMPPGARRTTSVENLLHSLEAPGPGVGTCLETPELQCLKHLELCSWFQQLSSGREVCGSVQEIWRGNIEEWILSYWFDGAESSRTLTEEEFVELQELVDDVVHWAGLPLMGADSEKWRGRNSALRCFRLRNDPLPAVHRPLFVYALTAFVGPSIGHRSLLGLGFRAYRSGSAEYWFRPPRPGDGWRDGHVGDRPHKNADWRRPVVFCHGIGVGPTMCLPFLQLLVHGLGEEYPIFLVDMGPISMRFSDDVPGAREFAANLVDMLEVWGFKQAHFVGHSFGSFLVAWMLRYQPSYVEKCTFVDPVCFLLLKVLAGAHQIQAKTDSRMDTMEMGIKYFVLTELFICNFVCRCFFWEESQLDVQDLDGKQALLVLESEDNLVPTHSIQRLVMAELTRRGQNATSNRHAGLDVLWIDGQPHAGFLVDAAANKEVNDRLVAFHG